MTPSHDVATTTRIGVRDFGPKRTRVSRVDLARGTIGALLGIIVAAAIVKAGSLGPEALPFIVAPIGASAVLVFAAPASPLAQPWSVIVGNISSAAVGIVAARLIDDTMFAAAVAVGTAIGVMMLLRALHPPGGACALFAAVGSPAVREQGLAFALWPVGINTLLLVAVAALVNNLTGRQYPHVPEVPPPAPRTDALPSERIGVGRADVERAMARMDQGLDIMPADVLALVHHAEEEALHRRLGRRRCETIMTRDVVVIAADDTLLDARSLLHRHHVKALPVLGPDRHVVGIVTVFDLFDSDEPDDAAVRTVMSRPVTTVDADTPVAQLVALMTDSGLRYIPVVDDTGRLVGVISRTELIEVLHQALLGEGP